MPTTKAYDDAQKERNIPRVRGVLQIKTIDPKLVEKYNIKPGQITPWSGLRIVGGM